MKFIALFLLFVSFSVQAATYTCSLHEESILRAGGKLLPNSLRTLDKAENGMIMMDRGEGVGPDGLTHMYDIWSYGVYENGCQPMFIRTGVLDNPATWNSVFADWCVGSEFTIYNPMDPLVHLYCISKP